MSLEEERLEYLQLINNENTQRTAKSNASQNVTEVPNQDNKSSEKPGNNSRIRPEKSPDKQNVNKPMTQENYTSENFSQDRLILITLQIQMLTRNISLILRN